MRPEAIKLFTTIKPALLRNALLKGTAIAGIGVIILAIAGTYAPPNLLTYLGPFVLILGGGLIAWGLLPYRKLYSLENSPNELIYTNGKQIQFIAKGKEVYTIPLEMIEKLDYIEKKNNYGIAIYLNKDTKKKIVVHNPRFDMASFQKKSQKKYNCDLFIPYFSERSFNRIQD